MKFEVVLHVGNMCMSATPAESYEEALQIKARLEKEWSDPLLTEGPGVKVEIVPADKERI